MKRSELEKSRKVSAAAGEERGGRLAVSLIGNMEIGKMRNTYEHQTGEERGERLGLKILPAPCKTPQSSCY